MSLSDKIADGNYCPDSSMFWLDVKDVKEFIKELKKELNDRVKVYVKAIDKTDNKDMEINYNVLAEQLKTIIKIINKKAGEKLLK